VNRRVALAQRRTRRARVVGSDRGAVALEFAVGALALLLGIYIGGAAYLAGQAGAVASRAADQAARAATLASNPTQAAAEATSIASTTLSRGRCQTDPAAITVDTSRMRPGGLITVTSHCRVRLLLGPTRTFTASSDQVVDRYRGGFGPGRP